MKSQCIQAVNQALGRNATQAETRDIELKLRNAMRQGVRMDPQWSSYSDTERAQKAAEIVAQQLDAAAAKKRQRVALGILAADRVDNYIADQKASGTDSNAFQSLIRMLANNPDGKSHVLSLEARQNAIQADFWRQMVPDLKLVKPIFLTLLRNKNAERLMWRAMAGDADVPPEYARAAKALHTVFDRMKTRYNAAGGDIGTLDNYDMPHSWSLTKVLKAGKDTFVNTMLPLMNRDRYVNEDGSVMSDQQMKDFLGEAWTTIATDGANKLDANVSFGNGIKANRHNQERQIHLKDGTATLQALGMYSDKAFLEALQSHVRGMARDIGLLEQFGPNPDLLIKSKLNKYAGELANADPQAYNDARHTIDRVSNLYNYLSGNSHEAPVNETLAGTSATIRNYISGVLTASSGFTRLTDNGTLYPTAYMNGLPIFKVFKNQFLHFASGEQREMARRMGLMLQTQMDTLNRFSSENLGQTWSKQFSSFMLRASLHNVIAEANQNAFSMTAFDALGKLTRNVANIADLEGNDGRFLKAAGVDQKTWDIWRMAELDKGRGSDSLLTADKIYQIQDGKLQAAFPGENPTRLREQAATALLGSVRSEEANAVMEPGATEHVQFQKVLGQKGTVTGELTRSMLMFKSYPLAIINRQIIGAWRRYEGMGRVGYLSAMLAGTTVMGAIANWLKDIVAGRDPRTLDPSTAVGKKNLLSAIAKGGGLGVYGDFLFDDANSYGAALGQVALGPVGERVAQLADLTVGYGKEMFAHPEAAAKINQQEAQKATTFIKGNFPGMNAWYAKAILDHLIFRNLNEYIAPGYNERLQARSQRLYGTSYWWQPSESMPSRLPQFQESEQ
jgi:hypothetical protein